MEFANRSPYKRAFAEGSIPPMARGFAIRDCAYDLYTQRRIMAVAIISVIRRRGANQFRESGVLLVSQPSRAQPLK